MGATNERRKEPVQHLDVHCALAARKHQSNAIKLGITERFVQCCHLVSSCSASGSLDDLFFEKSLYPAFPI
jgi:hypothetical protein